MAVGNVMKARPIPEAATSSTGTPCWNAQKPMMLNTPMPCKYLISVICRSSYEGAVDYIRFLRQIAGICQHDGEAYGKAVEYLSVCSHPYARIFKGGPVRSEQVLETICSARKRDAPYYQHQCQHEKYRQTDSA